MRLLSTTCVAMLFVTAVQAQTVDLRFTTTINVGAGTGGVDQLEVVVEADTDIDFQVGSSDFIFTFNTAALDVPSGANGTNLDLVVNTDYVYHTPFVAPFYNPAKVAMQEPNRLVGALNLIGPGVGAQLLAADGWTPIFTLYFDIVDDSSTEMLAWVGAPDPNRTVMYDGADNTTPITIGLMTNSDLPLDAPGAVELAGLQTTVNDGDVSLSWSTLSESGNVSFAIEASPAGENAWREVGYVVSPGESSEPRAYSYDVLGLDYGTWRMRLEIDDNGSVTYTPEIEVSIELASAYALGDVYPSPFSSTARFTLAVGEPQNVTIDAYNLLGQKVLTVFKGDMPANQTRVFELDGSGLSNGVYLIRASGESFATTTSVALVR